MSTLTITIMDAEHNIQAEAVGLLAPQALSTSHQTFKCFHPTNLTPQIELIEKTSGQRAVLLHPSTNEPTLSYGFEQIGIDITPENYTQFDNRYTRASLDLSQIIKELVENDTAQTAQRIVEHTASLFEYGHEDERFNDGHDEVPVIACGTAKGSCIDINTYLISALRVANIPTVYFAGYFFPQERGGITNDMHCWVATWIDGTWHEWDIAHHMKMGLGPKDVRPGYNPKPGTRFAITYGRGLQFDIDGLELTLSHLSEPLWLYADGSTQKAKIEAQLKD